MSEDYQRAGNLTDKEIEAKVLQQTNNFLESMGKNINSYALVPRILKFDGLTKDTRDTLSELNIAVSEIDLASVSQLNTDQRTAFNTILEAAYVNKRGCFFLDGPGGTQKTFLYKALLADVRSKGFIVLATASCGVAALILPRGRTAHSRFKVPIDLSAENMCKISKQIALADLLRQAKLIIWDEAPMTHKTAIEGVDKMFKDIMSSTELFGSKVIVLGGDFRQVLPVVTKGSKADFIQASIVNSYIRPHLQKLRLTQKHEGDIRS